MQGDRPSPHWLRGRSILKARTEVAAYASIVDAKDDKAKAFYEPYGFVPCVDQTRTLYLPLGK